MSVVSSSLNAFNETGRYAYATVEYTGLVSYNMVKRGGIFAYTGVRKVTDPVAATVVRPFVFVKDKTGILFGMKAREERIKELEGKLVSMEQRLASIEKHGIVPAGDASVTKKKKKVDEGKRLVLQGILEETRALQD
ncbi:MAG: hypothetical protein V3S89_11595 [Desulfobacterales bacterium]